MMTHLAEAKTPSSTTQPARAINQAQGLHLPNCWNCLQGAIYQLEQGNTARAIAFLEGAKGSLLRAGVKQLEDIWQNLP